jgi:hypothetical protein
MDLSGISYINTGLVYNNKLTAVWSDKIFMHIGNDHLWCYIVQAMVHELIGIQDNKVDVKSIGKFPKDQEVGYISFTG